MLTVSKLSVQQETILEYLYDRYVNLYDSGKSSWYELGDSMQHLSRHIAEKFDKPLPDNRSTRFFRDRYGKIIGMENRHSGSLSRSIKRLKERELIETNQTEVWHERTTPEGKTIRIRLKGGQSRTTRIKLTEKGIEVAKRLTKSGT